MGVDDGDGTAGRESEEAVRAQICGSEVVAAGWTGEH